MYLLVVDGQDCIPAEVPTAHLVVIGDLLDLQRLCMEWTGPLYLTFVVTAGGEVREADDKPERPGDG